MDTVKTVCGAVWSSCSKLALSRGTFGDGREWASQVREFEGNDELLEVEGWDIPSLLNLAKGEQIDLLKVDIEGSEIDLFGPQSLAWLPKVRNICIELHGPRCEEVFFHASKEFDYQLGRLEKYRLQRTTPQIAYGIRLSCRAGLRVWKHGRPANVIDSEPLANIR